MLLNIRVRKTHSVHLLPRFSHQPLIGGTNVHASAAQPTPKKNRTHTPPEWRICIKDAATQERRTCVILSGKGQDCNPHTTTAQSRHRARMHFITADFNNNNTNNNSHNKRKQKTQSTDARITHLLVCSFDPHVLCVDT
eukprot:Opistho-2@8372